MKKLVPALMLFSSVCYGQDYVHSTSPVLNDSLKKKSFFISANAGIGIPFKDYASTDAQNSIITAPNTYEINGYANVGFHSNLSAGAYPFPFLAAVVNVGYDESSFSQNILNYQLGDGFPQVQFNGDFKIWQFMAGPRFRIKLYDKAFMWVQGMAGLINANFPSFTVTNINPTIVNTYSFKNSNVPGYCFSFGFENLVSKTIGIVYTFSYTGAEVIYPSSLYSYQGGSQAENTPISMSFGCAQVTAGINFHL